METKEELRQLLLRDAKAAKPEWRAYCNALITERFLALPEYAAAKVIFSYLPLYYEVDTTAIHAAATAAGKQLFVPRIVGDDLEFVRYRADDAFTKSKFGVLEPTGEATAVKPDLVIVPLVGYDDANNRLGHGKGYYDRFLQGTGYTTVALAYLWQSGLMMELPAEEHDVKMDIIVTPADYKGGVSRR